MEYEVRYGEQLHGECAVTVQDVWRLDLEGTEALFFDVSGNIIAAFSSWITIVRKS